MKIKLEKFGVYNYQMNQPRAFGVARKKGNDLLCCFIHTCREQLFKQLPQVYVPGNYFVYYSSSIQHCKNIKKFISKCEKKLIKNPKERSKFRCVGRKFVMLITEFWKTKFRLGLLTILIRAGAKYEKISFNKCLHSCRYLSSEGMKAAVTAFFNGKFNCPRPNYAHCAADGYWLDEFEYLTPKEILSRFY